MLIQLRPKSLFTAGLVEFAPRTFPDAVTSATLILQHDGGAIPAFWFGFFLSLDQGATWMPWGAGGSGGLQTDVQNWLRITPPAGTNRQIRGFLFTLGDLSLGLAVELV